jgi:ribosomal-protein-alanine N-acetyltransferase
VSRTFEIIPVRIEMVEALAIHHAISFPDAWSAESFAQMLAIAGTYGYIAIDGDGMVGFVLARALAGEAEILTIAVDPVQRRKSIGYLLLREAMVEAKSRGATEMFLEVAQDNAAAIALYEGSGFLHIGRRIGYYRSGARAVDALTLRRPL